MILKHFSSNHLILDKVDSTNSYLQKLNEKTKQSIGTIVSAKNQQHGKGQIGNEWTVEAGKNLTFSLVVYPNIKTKNVFYLNIIASLAVSKLLADLKITSKIKWPNDILVDGKKICGILIENQISGDNISQSIIGVGLNVNQSNFKSILNATSILNQNVSVQLEDALIQVYGYLDFYYNLLQESNYKQLLKLYYNQMFWFNKKGDFIDSIGCFRAEVLGVTETGRLYLKREDGTNSSYDLKQVKFVY
jgi:BirA family biotin operon repressor/biotin-[acetyl-CoA-carboxylase] ligase